MIDSIKTEQKSCRRGRTYIGGQAVLEGVMMRGKTAYATAVRDPEGNIQVESRRLHRSKAMRIFMKIPIVRGVISFVASLVGGSKILVRSAEVYGDEGEPGRIEKWIEKKMHIHLMSVFSALATILGIVLAVGLFVALPLWLSNLIFPVEMEMGIWYNLAQGGIRLVIFILYIVIISLMRDIRRVFMYHGAEHKTITCFEKGLELTPENAKNCSRIHDRCGTTFLFLVMAISIIVYSVVNWLLRDSFMGIQNNFLRSLAQFGVKIAFLPVVAGVSYEVLKLLAKSQSKLLLPIKAPGFALQRLTTREPTNDMLQVAIAAFKCVAEMDEDPNIPETDFIVSRSVRKYTEQVKASFREHGIDESDAEWLVSLLTGLPRSELSDCDIMLAPSKVRSMDEVAHERLLGRPLWYILGDTEFYGCKIKVDERVLIPRAETELLAEMAVRAAERGDKILDLCTGSGCIAVSVAKHAAEKNVSVTAADLSPGALEVAAENARLNGVNVKFIESDMFSEIRGKFNLIVCNPPYICSGDIDGLQSEVRDFEPHLALDGGADGLDYYRRLAAEAHKHLVRGGTLLMECGIGQAQAIVRLFSKYDYTMISRDYDGVERFVRAVL